jgi:hypothetical protein
MRYACKILVGMPEGKRPLARPRSRWEDNIKMDLKHIWFVRTAFSGHLLSGSIKREEFIDQLSGYHLLKKETAPWNWYIFFTGRVGGDLIIYNINFIIYVNK